VALLAGTAANASDKKIREELVRDHLDTGHQDTPSRKQQLFDIFKRR
jgi:hypothetical protein